MTTKQINYGLHETIEGSHRTLSDAVTMYAIYYSDWQLILEELTEFYASEEWINGDSFSDAHRDLIQRRNMTLGLIKEIGQELRSVGLDVDLCDWASHDDMFDNLEAA